jgi:hypothetical protein
LDNLPSDGPGTDLRSSARQESRPTRKKQAKKPKWGVEATFGGGRDSAEPTNNLARRNARRILAAMPPIDIWQRPTSLLKCLEIFDLKRVFS